MSYHYFVKNNMTVQLTVQVTLMCSCVALGKTTWAVTLKAAGATQQEINTIETMIETNKQKKTRYNDIIEIVAKYLPSNWLEVWRYY